MSLFNGRWKIDIERSTVWDAESKSLVPDEIGDEIITIHEADGVQDYEVLYGDDPVITMGYTATFDAAEWVPYLVRKVEPRDPDQDVAESVAAFRTRIKSTDDDGPNARKFVVGEPYGLVRMVHVDARTQYRVSKHESGEPSNVMLRRMAEDGSHYVAYVLDAEGVLYRVRTFVQAG